jgi:acyl-CoA thioesterase FadM
MFYFFRLFHIVFEALFGALWRRVRGGDDAVQLSETRQWRCMPWDLDEYRHMNNCSYFVFTEMGRRALFYGAVARQQDATLRRQLASAVAAGHYMRYRKSLQCFQVFSVVTSIVGTRGRSIWFEQRFVDAKGFVCAQSVCRITLVDREGVAFRCLGLTNDIALPRVVELFAQTDDESSEMLKK